MDMVAFSCPCPEYIVSRKGVELLVFLSKNNEQNERDVHLGNNNFVVIHLTVKGIQIRP